MQKTLQVFLPYAKSYITQRFGENANPLYAGQGLKGHTAYDWGANYGTPIPCCTADSYCYSRMNEEAKDLSKYKAVFFLVETEAGIYEISYGHLSGFVAEVGKTYQVGDVIGFVGNTGPVFSSGVEVTEKQKEAGSHAGSHLHGPQIRPVKKVTKRATNKQYLVDAKGLLKKDGFYFEILDYENGYNGCVSLASFSTETPALKQDNSLKLLSLYQQLLSLLKKKFGVN